MTFYENKIPIKRHVFLIFVMLLYIKRKEEFTMKKHLKKFICLFGLLFTLVLTDNKSMITSCDTVSYQTTPPKTEPGDNDGIIS